MIVDVFLTYQFIRRYVTPFKNWPAFKLGIIDENGKVLRKRSTLVTEEERAAFGTFDVLVLNLKKATMSGSNVVVPAGITLALMREDASEETIAETVAVFMEDAAAGPANNVGGGAVAGLGVGAQGEPGAYRKKPRRGFNNLKRIIKRRPL